jgi:hypothetical protein
MDKYNSAFLERGGFALIGRSLKWIGEGKQEWVVGSLDPVWIGY